MPSRIDPQHPYTPSRGVVAGQTFRSWHSYKTALAHAHGFQSHELRRRKTKPQRRRGDSDVDRRALRVLALVRNQGYSLDRAAREERTTPGTVLRRVGRQGLRRSGRQYRATKTDSLLRVVWVPGKNDTSGMVGLRSSREASRLGRYNNDVKRALRYRRPAEIARWRGQQIGGIELETDLDELRRMYDAGLLDFDSIYEAPS